MTCVANDPQCIGLLLRVRLGMGPKTFTLPPTHQRAVYASRRVLSDEDDYAGGARKRPPRCTVGCVNNLQAAPTCKARAAFKRAVHPLTADASDGTASAA